MTAIENLIKKLNWPMPKQQMFECPPRQSLSGALLVDLEESPRRGIKIQLPKLIRNFIVAWKVDCVGIATIDKASESPTALIQTMKIGRGVGDTRLQYPAAEARLDLLKALGDAMGGVYLSEAIVWWACAEPLKCRAPSFRPLAVSCK